MPSKRKIAVGSLLLLCLTTGAAAAYQYVSTTNGVTTAFQTGPVGSQYVRISPTETVACQEGRCVTVTDKGEVITSTENDSTFDSPPVGAIINDGSVGGKALTPDGKPCDFDPGFDDPAENERIRTIVCAQMSGEIGNDSALSGDGLNDGGDGRGSGASGDAAVDAETQRIRGLFGDRSSSSTVRTNASVADSVSSTGNGGSGISGSTDAEVDAERARIRGLFADRDNTTSGTGADGTGTTDGGTSGGIRASGMSCPESRSFLNIFGGAVTCGNDGQTIPIVISGDCPITACILKYRSSTSSPGFAGPIDF